jgi:hypothetical protein
MVGIDCDHGVGANLMKRGPHLSKAAERLVPACESVDQVIAESRPKREGVVSATVRDIVVAGTDLDNVGAIAGEDDVVAAPTVILSAPLPEAIVLLPLPIS